MLISIVLIEKSSLIYNNGGYYPLAWFIRITEVKNFGGIMIMIDESSSKTSNTHE